MPRTNEPLNPLNGSCKICGRKISENNMICRSSSCVAMKRRLQEWTFKNDPVGKWIKPDRHYTLEEIRREVYGKKYVPSTKRQI